MALMRRRGNEKGDRKRERGWKDERECVRERERERDVDAAKHESPTKGELRYRGALQGTSLSPPFYALNTLHMSDLVIPI